MQGSQDKELNKILHEKLSGFEANVPDSSRDFVLDRLSVTPAGFGGGKKIIYSAIVFLVVIGSYLTFTPFAKNGISSKEVSNSDVRSIIDDVKIASAKNSDVSPDKTNDVLPADKNENGERKTKLEALPALKNDNAQSGRMGNGQVVSTHTSEFIASQADADITIERKPSASTDTVNATTVKASEVIDSAARPSLVKRKLRYIVSVMPFLNYRRIQPNGSDGAHLDGFSAPAGVSIERLGFKTSLGLDYELKRDLYVFGGLSYFNYRTKFSYNSNEQLSNINVTNDINENVKGMSILAGARFPLKLELKRSQFLSVGLDYQFLLGNYYPLTSTKQVMVNAGYANDFNLGNGRIIRLQPTVSYSLTKFQYGGLATSPYWFGLDVAYSWER